jgi:hypothetical protein
VKPTKIATITRERVYSSFSHPGPAWKWVYEVTVPGEPCPFKGDGLRWAHNIAKSHGATKIIEAWKN